MSLGYIIPRLSPDAEQGKLMPETTAYPRNADLGAALGRVPSGLFILTVRDGGRATGILASWVQQAGFDPPMVTLALHKERFVGDWVRSSGRLVLNQVAIGNKTLLRHFGKGFQPDEPAFQGLKIEQEHDAGPVLAEALAYLIVEPAGEVAGGDHFVILGRVVEGGLIDPKGQPLVHIRQNGLHY